MRRIFPVITVIAAIFGFTSIVQADEFGYVFCQSTPSGAIVSFDHIDSVSFETPFMRTMDVGEHRATVTLPGYTRKNVTFRVGANEVTKLNVDFTEGDKTPTTTEVLGPIEWETGKLTVLADRQAVIYLDDKKLDLTAPATFEKIKIGSHQIALEHNGETFSTPLVIKGGEVNKVEALFDSSVSPRGILWPRPVVTVHLTLELPACDYRVRESNPRPDSNSSFRGVDNQVRINGLEEVVMITSSTLLKPTQFQDKELHGLITGGDTVIVRQLEVPIDSLMKFEFNIFANPVGKFRNRKEVTEILKRHRVAANFNNGRDIHVKVQIQPDGDLIFRYW